MLRWLSKDEVVVDAHRHCLFHSLHLFFFGWLETPRNCAMTNEHTTTESLSISFVLPVEIVYNISGGRRRNQKRKIDTEIERFVFFYLLKYHWVRFSLILFFSCHLSSRSKDVDALRWLLNFSKPLDSLLVHAVHTSQQKTNNGTVDLWFWRALCRADAHSSERAVCTSTGTCKALWRQKIIWFHPFLACISFHVRFAHCIALHIACHIFKWQNLRTKNGDQICREKKE